ncbi:McrC family protein [Arcobacter cryaerophilus gv. pseudocryaerophilus]|uniref:McrC family protein n=3 Tax=unclassified Arcobacter TaxID=2593671 RepID=A0AA96L3P3_9BACT|nr:McrC family protein [Arcobacter sp. AZ-2023]WPD06180.1 McrC family protein [Arcobacter sp. DSM 115956]WPD08271.1 McrC family protein [Arcobacter sp. DSM 115955]WNL32536.1 McrC family protein [Arcobacter sp. AZ-2023]WNP38686.1 McrC family protein [Arcobacter sp. AZ-2023]
MKKEFILKEFEYLQYKDNTKDNFIKKETFDSLEKFVLENEKTAQYLKITTKKGFGKVLQAQNYVGVIQTKDGTTIEILPKIKNATTEKSKDILIKMLKTLKNSPFKNLSVANLKSSKIPLFEIFISMFLEELTVLVRNGIKSDYISKEENLKFLKGKLKISEQIKYNTIHKERFFVQYEEFISNRVENRLIKTTLQFLYNKSKLNKNQQRIREFLFVFDEIEISHNIKTDFSKIKLNRQMKDYEQVLLWCKTFLFENSFSPYKGNDIAFALLFDMNLLFESFVYSYLKKSSNFQDIKSQDRTHHLAYENGIGRFRLKPDIVINGGKIIADTKWKILSEDKAYNGVLQDDMYQLYAYGTKYDNCEKIYLIYPFDELIIKNSYNYFKNKELKLDILFFDVYKKEFKGKNIEL